MILDSKAGVRGVLVDADTGRRIPLARWADTETGEYEAFRTADGRTPLRDVTGRPVAYRGKARLRFVPTAPAPPKRTPPPRPGQPRPGQRLVITPGVRCEHPGCGRWAEWRTADEQELEPEVTPAGPSERARTVRTHDWCSWHYQWPLFTSLRGVVREVTTTRARPA